MFIFKILCDTLKFVISFVFHFFSFTVFSGLISKKEFLSGCEKINETLDLGEKLENYEKILGKGVQVSLKKIINCHFHLINNHIIQNENKMQMIILIFGISLIFLALCYFIT